MSIPVSVLDMYKYYIEKVILVSPAWTTPYEIDGKLISALSILNNFDTAIAPQLSITCNVSYDTYYEILAKAKNISASFIISKAIVGNTANPPTNSVDKAAFNTEWVRCEMKATDQGYLYSRDVVENKLDQTNNTSTSNPNTKSMDKQIKLFLYDANKLIKYRKNKSYVINGNMNDVLYEVLNSRGIDNILLSSALDEEKADFAIPFGDLGQNLVDLNNIYGIYDHRYIYYQDLDRTYLINTGNLGNDVEFGELGTVNIYIENYDGSSAANLYAGCFKDDINKLYILGSYDVTIDNIDTLEDFSSGSKITTVAAGTQKHWENKVGEYDVEKSYLLSNDKLSPQLIASLKEAKRTLTVTVKNVDLNIITPNKKYVILANEKYYDSDYNISGEYRLKSSAIGMLNDGNGTFSASVSMTLVKIN